MRATLGILAIAVVVRAAWIVAVPVIPVSDSARYDLFAQNLAAGKGYVDESGPTALWPVGPSFLFSLCYRITGWDSPHRFVPVAIMNLLLAVTSVVLTMHLARKWFSPRVAIAAGLLLALWPSQIEFTTVLNSDIPMNCFMLAALAFWFADRPAAMIRGVLAGACLAAAAYMRPTALLLPLVFALSHLIQRPRRLATLGGALTMAVTMFALILPWSLRNQRVFGEFVLISANGGLNFWIGNNPETTGFYQKPPKGDLGNQAQRDRRLRDQAFAYIRQDPWLFLKRTALKAVRLHERETIGVHWNLKGLQSRYPPMAIPILKWISHIYWLAALGLAVAGLAHAVARRGLLAVAATPPVLIWAYFTSVYAVFFVSDRYHFAFIPFVAMLAGGLLVTCLAKLKQPFSTQPAAQESRARSI